MFKIRVWKLVAIIFIIISLVEFSLIVWAINLGTQSIEDEATCSIEVCADAEAYLFDDIDNACYCYIDQEVVHQEII